MAGDGTSGLWDFGRNGGVWEVPRPEREKRGVGRGFLGFLVVLMASCPEVVTALCLVIPCFAKLASIIAG